MAAVQTGDLAPGPDHHHHHHQQQQQQQQQTHTSSVDRVVEKKRNCAAC
jgi:hypothetical protein